MKSLVTAYLAAFMFAFRAHHNIKGATFVADHSLLGEFYNAYLTEADGLIELTMTEGTPVNEAAAQMDAAKALALMTADTHGTGIFAHLFRIESELRESIDVTIDACSTAMQNHLQGLANASLARSYKIKQRLG